MQLRLKKLGTCDYSETWRAMSAFTEQRTPSTIDELWLLEHPSVYTLGRNGKPEHILDSGNIPVMQSDRGGQVTYHGMGQLIAYTLFDLRRLDIGVRRLVSGLENAVIATLAQYGIPAQARADAPGVYVDGQKIAALGLRVKQGCCYHGLSLNVNPDLAPFARINPCGYAGLQVTSLCALGVDINPLEAAVPMIGYIQQAFGYQEFIA
ncbi:lipoyl(octanoyl) transferase LipB [Candidatus Methylospira mobilis]|uniref:Octanoyltransferase n=1 Tax=Candidatus Methylospira mobilis TaxID=1808979 RepID=A0A5Q0BQT2_9GAMM|nr:lipoyl(octanoyl) transferase LipB [Candidatus Methylospira mobilis]QFY44554.1 lipoyl(octanoyl) transferase LipB [Candidatus Methylospira mobilis]